jgi:uncharacterized iron-regulated membrane protein
VNSLAAGSSARTRDLPSPAPARAVRRPLAFLLHSLFGLKLSLFLGFVCLTGTIATVSHEIEWLLQPAVRGASDGRTDDYAAIWALVKARHPDAYIQSIGTYDRADSRYFARQADIVLPDGTERRLYIDPGTMRVTGEATGQSFHSVMRALHYYLLLPTDLPFYLVTSLGFVLILSLVTGLLTYKKFWRGFFRLPRWQRSTRTWAGDLHRVIGLSSSAPGRRSRHRHRSPGNVSFCRRLRRSGWPAGSSPRARCFLIYQ